MFLDLENGELISSASSYEILFIIRFISKDLIE